MRRENRFSTDSIEILLAIKGPRVVGKLSAYNKYGIYRSHDAVEPRFFSVSDRR